MSQASEANDLGIKVNAHHDEHPFLNWNHPAGIICLTPNMKELCLSKPEGRSVR